MKTICEFGTTYNTTTNSILISKIKIIISLNLFLRYVYTKGQFINENTLLMNFL